MATTSEKYRINALAKDFNLKSKDLITILDNAGFAGKTHMAVLEENELSIIFETLTQNNQVDITAFFKKYDDKKNAKKEEERKAKEAAKAAADEEKRKKKPAISKELRDMIDRMQRSFGTKVTAIGNDNKGRIYIDYYSAEEGEENVTLYDLNYYFNPKRYDYFPTLKYVGVIRYADAQHAETIPLYKLYTHCVDNLLFQIVYASVHNLDYSL